MRLFNQPTWTIAKPSSLMKGYFVRLRKTQAYLLHWLVLSVEYSSKQTTQDLPKGIRQLISLHCVRKLKSTRVIRLADYNELIDSEKLELYHLFHEDNKLFYSYRTARVDVSETFSADQL